MSTDTTLTPDAASPEAANPSVPPNRDPENRDPEHRDPENPASRTAADLATPAANAPELQLESTDSTTPAPATVPDVATPGVEEPVAPIAPPEQPRVQLKPSATETMRPVPSLDPSAQPVAPAPVPVPDVATPGIDVRMPSAAPIAVPRAGELDASLEAEINAAMTGVSLAAPSAPRTDGEAGETAEAPPQPADETLPKGRKVKGRVVAVHNESILLDLGVRANGVLPARNFEEGKLPEVGANLDVIVDRYDPAEGLIHVHQARGGVSRPAGNWDQVAVDQIVDCMVTKTNKGGLEVSISNLRGFLPASQVDYGFVQNLEQYVGQKLRVKVTEVNPHKRNLVVSRKAFLEIERSALREQAWANLQVGQVVTGTVKTVKDYGAFVDIGGVDGLLHVGEMSWSRVGHPKDVVSLNQQIQVKILSIDKEKQKVSLGMKELQPNPWSDIESKYPVKSTVHGKVTKTTEFGAFVQLEPGVEGLIHISELDHRRVHRVTDVLKVDQEVDAQVLSIDIPKKRIALSIKSLIAKPHTAREERRDEDMAPSGGKPYERKRRADLKGGGTASGGFSFGGEK